MLSLNGLVILLENKQQNHDQLSEGTFYFGDPWEFGANQTITYPFFGARLLPSGNSLTGNVLTNSIEIFFCNLVNKDESNETQVLSDLETVALDIYSQLRTDLKDYYKANINETAQLNPFTERFDDEVSGWSIVINIEQFYDRSTCDTPDSGANAGKVIIYDADGDIVAILNPNSIYTLDPMYTETAETYTVTGTTQSILHTPHFIFGVYMNGQRLTLTTDYTVTGTTITFVTALASDTIVVVYNY